MTNTKPSTPPKPEPPKDDDGSKSAEAFAELEAELEHERDRRKEERFAAIVIGVILLNIIFMHDSPSETLPLAVVLLELPLLLFLASRMGIDEIKQILDRMLGVVGSVMPGNGKKDE